MERRHEELSFGRWMRVPVSRKRANLRRRRRCGSLKFLHVQARPREIKFNGVSDEDLSWPHTRTAGRPVDPVLAYVQRVRCTMHAENLSRGGEANVHVYTTLSRRSRGHIISVRVHISSHTNCPTQESRDLFLLL